MPTVQFRTRVVWRNTQVWPASGRRFRVPQAVAANHVRVPIYVSAERMQRLAPSRTIAVVAGLTDAEVVWRFENATQQWRRLPPEPGTPARWQFQGGVVHLELRLALYVAQGFQRSSHILNTIMEHELLHVADELQILSRELVPALQRNATVRRHLTEGGVMLERQYQSWVAGGRFSRMLRDDVWAPLHNRRNRARDSGPAWEAYRRRIDELMRRTR